MQKKHFEGAEIQFNNLSEEMQKEMYLKDKRKFKKEASKSVFESVRELVARDKKTSSEILNEMLRNEIEEDNDEDIIDSILNKPNFKMELETRKVLAKSEFLQCRRKVAQDEETSSKLLNQMLRDEVINDEAAVVIDDILDNPNFKMEDETRKLLANLRDYEYRLIVAQDEGTSRELLENMYSEEFEEEVFEALEHNLLKKVIEESTKLNAVQKEKIFDIAIDCVDKEEPLAHYLEKILEIIC